MLKHLYNLATDEYKGFLAAIIKFFLLILSFIYAIAVGIISFLCRLRQRRLDCKVISVGNITLGGTGKTTLVEYIARFLLGQGRKVAILTRGYTEYGRRNTDDVITADEPLMLSKKLADVAVIVDKDRARGAGKAIKEHGVDTVILDDGFQQWKIKKDLEIAAVSAGNPFGNRRLIPRGILREPLSSLKRADIIMITKVNLASGASQIRSFLKSISPAAVICESMHSPAGCYNIDSPGRSLGLQELQGKRVCLFSGIGDSGSFEGLVKGSGVQVALCFNFPDHYRYSESDLSKIFEECRRNNIDTIITTEKDAARLYGRQNTDDPSLSLRAGGIRILVLRIELKITDNEKEFHNRLLRIYPA